MDNKKRDLIVFGEDWGSLPSSTQHIMKQLSYQRKIVWVNSIGLRGLSLKPRDILRASQKLYAFIKKDGKKNIHAKENITIVNPMTIPAPKHKITRKLASYLLKKQVLKVTQQENLHKPILWTSLPTTGDLIGAFNESADVYYCGDDFSGLAGVDHKVVEEHEKQVIKHSHLIIAASNRLRDKLPNEKTRTLSHGVDFELFSQPQARAKDFPNPHRPTAGFYGSLSEWLDTKLLFNCAKALPNWNFLFIGKENTDVSELKKLHNCIFLGERPHSDLPSYSQHWDVSLLPFKKCRQIEFCNPLKLYEYLAVGKPIVSTDFPAVRAYSDLIQRASTDKEFMLALKLSREFSDLPQLKRLSKDRVKDKTWYYKSQQVSNWLDVL